MKRIYIIPTKYACNADCTFCYMEEKDIDKSKPEFLTISKLEKAIRNINDINETELTGGGEPLLNPEIGDIINFFMGKNIYTKMYTNGFLLKDLAINEINISRVHWDSQINNDHYRSKSQNDLNETLDHYQKYAGKIRMQTILLKGAIDNQEKALEFISNYEDKVDVFMFRTLFPKTDLEKQNFVPYFEINHPKVKIDKTLDNYDKDVYFVDSAGTLYDHFHYG